MIILNIGLVTSHNHYRDGGLPQGDNLAKEVALSLLEKYGFNVLWNTVAQSSTEKTLVAGVSAHGLTDGDRFKLNKIASLLQQDCIAVFDTTCGEGHLIGDYADDWGTFNPEYFLVC